MSERSCESNEKMKKKHQHLVCPSMPVLLLFHRGLVVPIVGPIVGRMQQSKPVGKLGPQLLVPHFRTPEQ